ncbi:MAG: thiamine phosphate synthase [Candidatus Dormibacteria bacterium]
MSSRIEEARDYLAAARLYVISADSDPSWQAEVLCQAIDGGAGVVQLRHKAAAPADLLDAARRVARHATAHGAVFIVNDTPELVEASGADGVHAGQDAGTTDAVRVRLPEGSLVGRSTHSLAQAQEAAAGGADYIGVGPVHATPTKPGRAAVGLGLVTEVARAVDIPWFAIGGLDRDNLTEVIDAGAQRVAVVRAVAAAADPGRAAAELLAQLQRVEATA